MRFLVTGGAGFIGSHLCERLLARGHTVRVIDDLSSGKRENLPAGVELRIGDATERDFVRETVAGIDGIFHLAAIASAGQPDEDWFRAHRVNQTAAVVVLNAARAAGRVPVVLASSAAVYGNSNEPSLQEDALPRPLTAYGADKFGAELQARIAWEAFQVPTASLRLFNVYGSRQDPASPYSGVISIFAERLRHGCPPILHGDGQQTRDFVHVDDATRHLEAAMASLMAKPRGLVCNVCTGCDTTIKGLARRMAALTGRRDLAFEFAPARPGDIRFSRGDPRHAARELEVRAETTLDTGLSALLT